MTASHECPICLSPVNGSSVVDVGHGWSASIPTGHAPLLGWVTIHPLAHRTSPDELTPSEASRLGTLIRDGSRFLRSRTGATRMYVANWAERTPHVHFHLIPRPAGLDEELTGAGIFSMMSGAGDGPSLREQLALLQELGEAVQREEAS